MANTYSSDSNLSWLDLADVAIKLHSHLVFLINFSLNIINDNADLREWFDVSNVADNHYSWSNEVVAHKNWYAVGIDLCGG